MIGPRERLFDLLEAGVAEAVFPGCVAIVWRDGATLYHEAHGLLATHPNASHWHRPVARDTLYDLASLTKVLGTTTLTALAVGEGLLALDETVPAPWSRACPGATLVDLLEHAAGLAAHREYFLEVAPFDRDAVLACVSDTPPAYPRRTRAVYSDLGFMILGAWLERIHGCGLAQAFEDRVVYRLGLRDRPGLRIGYRPITAHPPAHRGSHRIAPTEVYARALHPEGVPSHHAVRVGEGFAHGTVHDDNAYVMGGVAGHAGLFGTAEAVLEVARAWLTAGLFGLDARLRDRFWQASTVPGSTRRLGFDGPAPDGSGSTGTAVSAAAVGHTGYTGTSVWIDPQARGGPAIYVLLSNRVHPTRNADAIKRFRQRFHAAAAELA